MYTSLLLLPQTFLCIGISIILSGVYLRLKRKCYQSPLLICNFVVSQENSMAYGTKKKKLE